MRRFSIFLTFFFFVAGVCVAQETPKAMTRPAVAGDWTGTWGIFQPGVDEIKPYKMPPLKLECKVVEKDGKYEATFSGEAGKPYKYVITMEGRLEGGVVLFKGTTDLGEKDGGVYDWIGKATDKEFIGFYTNKAYTGFFRLVRPKPVTSEAPAK